MIAAAAEEEMNKALNCLYYGLDESIVVDVKSKVNAYILELKNKIKEFEKEVESWKNSYLEK